MDGEFAGGAPPVEDFTKMSVEDRLASKAWKARVSAYEELVKSFARTSSDADPIFRTYARNPELIRAMVVDSNAVAQEKGVDAARAFVEFGGNAAGRTREVVVPSLVEKCLGSTRAGTKKNALELVMLYAENEDVMGCEGLTSDLLAGLKAKQPKVVAGCVAALKDLTRDFGHKQVKPNQILKKLPDIFAHSDKTVRAEGALLAQELYRCIGAAIEPTISALKEIQAKELRQQFEAIEGKSTPTRFLISQRAVVEAAAAAAPAAEADAGGDAADDGAGGQDDEDDIDPYDLADPVDVFGSRDFPDNLDEMLASKKWQERKEALEAVLKVMNSSLKMKPDSRFDGLADSLAHKITKDANINVVLVSCQCLEAMAKGLREGFARYKEKVVPPIIEKLKEKKASTVEVLAKTLDAIFQTVSFSDILENVLNGLKHKNPSVKTESIRFLVRCLRTTRTPPAKGDIKPIGDALVAAMGDGSPDVRDAGAAGLGTLMKLIGERPMNAFLEPLDDIKKGKVQDEYKVAEVKVKMATAGPPKKAAAAAPAPARAAPAPRAAARPAAPAAAAPVARVAPAAAPVARAPPPRMVARKPAAAPAAGPSAGAKRAGGAAAPAGAGRAGGKGGPASATEPVKYRFNSEDAEARAADLIPEGIAAQLASGVWKDRLAGMTDFNAWLEREVDEVEAEIIVRALGKKPGWKESNFQVLAEVYKALRKLAEASPTFGRPSVALSVQPLCDKLGDIKLKGPAAETLGLYAEKTSYGFLLNQALGPLAGLKAPKAIADSILWVDQSLLEFGTAGVDVRGLIGYLVTCLKSANAGVRTNATKAIGTLARFLGTTLNSFLGDLNPQLKTTIEAEIEQAASNPPPAPTRFSDENRLPEAAAGGGGGGRGGDDGAAGGAGGGIDEDLLDELVPRVDIDKLVHGSTVARMSDANWKERKEALEEIQGIVTANTRLKGNMTELAAALKLRYSDSNIMCKTLALDVAAKIATGMNKNFEPHARILVGPITQVLSDAKAPVRASAVATLTAIAEQIGVGPMVPGFCSVLESSKIANPMLRQELFAWLGAWFEGHMPEKGMDLAGLALPAVQSLDDKLAAVRKAAQSALPYIVLRAGYKFVLEQANQLKAASRNTVVPLIDAAKSQAAALQPAAAARAAPAPAAAPAAARPGLARPGAARPAAAPAASAGPSSSGSSPVSAVRASSAVAAARAGSPTPASPRASTIARPGGLRPPSAVGRSLKAPSASLLARQSRIPSSEEPDIGVPQSRLGMTKRAPAAASSSSSAPSSSSVPDQGPPFLSADLRPKALREKREGRGQNWIGAEGAPRPELVDVLRSQCEGSLSRGLIDSLFSKGNSAEKEYMSALTLIANFVSSPSFAEEEYGLSPDDTNGRIVANSDLVFKYVAIRLTDNNTTMSLKCLDILEQLVDLLSGQQFHMSDYEANSLLPCLLAKFGDPKVTFRDRIREIFRKLTFIFPPSKLFTHYMENGLPSKNARVRTECLGELGHLIAKNGLQVCSPAKTFPVIAKQISDRDANVRTAALMALGEAYKLVGDDVWKMIGSLPGKEMSLLEERLKRTAAPAAKPSAIARAPASKMGRATPGADEAGPSISSPARASSVRAGPGMGLARPGSMVASALPAPGAAGRSRLPAPGGGGPGRRESAFGIPRPAAARTSAGGAHDYRASPPPSPSLPSQEMGSSRSRSSSQSQPSQYAYVRNSGSRLANSVTDADVGYDDDEADARQDGFGDADRDDDDDGDDGPYGGTGSLRVEQTINEILSSDAERSVAALKDVHQFLEQGEPSMVSHADQLGNVLAKQAHRAFSMADSDAGNERLIKHILFDLLSMFDKELVWDEGRPLGSYLGKQTLVPLLTELLQQLIEESAKPPGDERAQTLAKYLNNVVLKCFSACDLNALYGACLSMLTEATEDMRELSGAVLDTRVKFAELTMKCLWKIAKRLPSCLAEQQIDPAQLIADIEEFMKVITPNEWKRRAADGVPMGDMPLKTMKVILTHITSTFGEESLSMLELLESPESSHVYSYLMRLLNQHGAGPADRGAAQPSPEAGESERAAARPARSRASVDGNGNGNGNGASYAAPSANSAPGSPRASANGDGGVGHGNGQGNGAPRVVSTDVEDPATAELRAIFERISHKEQSRIAIRQLYEFQKKYPHKEPSIQRALQNTGPIFQRYVKRALANHAADDLEASSAVASPQLGETERPESGTFTSSARTSLRSSLNMDAGAGAASTAAVTPSLPTSASFARHSPSSSISASTSTTSPKGSSHLRSSTHDDRLAELRAKFAKTSTGSSISSSSSSVSTSRADMTAAGGGGGGGGGGAAEVD
ncbi:related to STU2 - Microtubule-associated protein (MAP) of the XMAP215/Dis1 family [Pseudozyma flocculosa]|uniref:Related to STU2 - Microtubule-associated protein (MAP) of the XMAP215/Dis1 family n=1 Tax=Pseudozyma flocculosa TaxID=84751 RepID=A0A5C3F101_9BASI|nr:related to STU2 - Microtubule-associated protein (MAP) of the XMAP215/Dis1 family [Pseudozyma flocculosa]